MTRNLKALGLALVAVFAMSAVAASAASAQTPGMITVESGTASVTALSAEHKFTSPAGTIECTESEFNASVASGEEEVTITPRYGGTCTAAGQPATVDVNGCDYTLNDVTTNEAGTDYEGTVDIVCPPGEPGIVVTAFAGTGHGFRVCTITVPPQTGISPITITNTPGPPDDVDFSGTATGISYTKSGLCGSETGTASYDLGNTTVTASSGGTATGLTVSD